MASRQDVLYALMLMDESAMISAINLAFSRYVRFLSNIYNDIYDSCIKLYYAGYYPDFYDRHDDKSGFNLYSASDIYAYGDSITISWDEDKLLLYKGKEDKREIVLESVLDGIRGVGSYKNMASGWPRDWEAYYPNEYSNMDDWSSGETTLRSILEDFSENGANDTVDIFYNILGNYV